MEETCEEEESSRRVQTPQAPVKEIRQVHGRLNVLLADSDATSRKTTSGLLLEAGFQVAVANDGAEALEIVKDSVAFGKITFDALLVDKDMPHVSGNSLANALRHSPLAHIPVFLMCSEVNNALKEDAANSVRGLIAKPIQKSFVADFHNCLLRIARESLAQSSTSLTLAGLGIDAVKFPKLPTHSGLDLLKPKSSQNDESYPIKPKAQRAMSLSQSTKSAPETYQIRASSLPVPIISQDFLKSPIQPVPKLHIEPLNLNRGLPQPADSWKGLRKIPSPEESQDTGSHRTHDALGALHFTRSSPSESSDHRHSQVPSSRPRNLFTKGSEHLARLPDAIQNALERHKQRDTSKLKRKAAMERLKAKKGQRVYHRTVRYESRKRLADQRPRVKGQFVKAADLEK